MIRSETIEPKTNGIAARSLAAAGIGERLSLSLISVDGGTQSRASLYQNVVEDYAYAIIDGVNFPPVVVFYDGSAYWMADGFHRFHAHVEAGCADIAADIRQGTRRDAILYSVGANSEHGLRRTNDDKRRAVLTLLNDAEWAGWSDREIARQCAVDGKTVAKFRAEVTAEFRSEDRTYTTKHGTTATMNTAAIGKPATNQSDEEMDVMTDEAPSSEPVSLLRGKLSTPEGMTLEEVGRAGLALEADGLSANEAAKKFNIGIASYRKLCDIVFLADRGEYSKADAATIGAAVKHANDTQRIIEAWDIAAPVAAKVWGDGSDTRPRADREEARLDRFQHVFGIVEQTCASASEMDVPYLTEDAAKSAVRDLKAARQNLQTLINRIEEVQS